ncbi:MAG: 4-hydroxy-tetrahydrodipicolinate synthase [Lentisphaerae bacterium RIFOXYA12_FULL_48_11]|nr:MAG: 4-hydroxy-tetrahydrodipicolinate synthase [Lentisphaerae bacterium RIFOXYA12_FULL_48_11]
MFKGAYTAIVTPFNKDGSVDFGNLRDLIDMQARAGIDGIVPVGTTGESPTLDYGEHSRVIEFTIDACRGRMKVIAGTGANSTSEAVDLTRRAMDAGADGTLQVTPYYNKPNQEGLVRHFSAIADLGLPVVLYNVPGRTSREISVETIMRLSLHPKIVAVKEAGGSVDRVSDILSRCRITVLSGDDMLMLPMMAVGAKGIISVASNVIPEAVAKIAHLALKEKWDMARKLHLKYYKFFCDLFIDTNPIPVKAAMAMLGLTREIYRLPLCPMNPAFKKTLHETMKKAGILKH